ncbi:MAG: oxidoreductase [Gammaproteobacteria bacterium]|nr:oxidoreductase [Gammaproteobacteria bacterium]
MGRLEEKVAVITGGAGGIGVAAAKRFVAEGAKVLLVDLDEQALVEASNEVGSNVSAYCVADVSQKADTERYVQQAVDVFGGVDIYLANAGIEGLVTPFLEQTEAMFDQVMAVNVKGVWLGVQSMFPVMQARGGGSIIITSSVAGIKGASMLAPYVTSKHAVVGLMRSAALAGAEHNIRVNTVNPSPVETRMMRSLEAGMMPDDLNAAHDMMSANIPLGRYAEPADIANMMLFLASDEGAFMTGGVYMADGGSSAR